MKKRILVLDAFTNGHDAALKFARRQGWKKNECEIVFCGNHNNLLKQLSEGPGYGVIPIHNSTKGEVTSVTKELVKLRNLGYDLSVVDTLKLRINHCLLVPKNITSVDQLEMVFSKEEAIGQCGGFLDRNGIAIDKRINLDSTGYAAKYVSGKTEAYGAIAPKRAAKPYGLRVLFENIQDIQRNITTFELLENKAEVKALTLGIIGHGGFGKALEEFGKEIGLKVIWSDPKEKTCPTNAEVVKQANVVIFALPIRKTPSVIRSVAKYLTEDKLAMDITSVKSPAVHEMLKSRAQVVGLHPMFAPSLSFDDQTMVVCPARLNKPEWKKWLVNLLARTEMKIEWSNPTEHDIYMQGVQTNPHMSNLINAVMIAEMGISVQKSLAFTSPFYRVMFSLMGRLLNHNADLYIDMLLENPVSLETFQRRGKLEMRIAGMIGKKDRRGLHKLFGKAKAHFGPDVIKEADTLFQRLIAVTKTIYGKNSIILEYSKDDDKPGLGEKILKAFGKRSVNLTGFNFAAIDGNRMQFSISFESSKSSDAVRLTLEEIEKWQDVNIRVVS